MNKLRVEIDERIKQTPELYAAILKGTEYFESEFETLPADPLWADSFLKWFPTPGQEGFLRTQFSETHLENGGYIDSIDMPARQLHDEISRNTLMRRLLSRIVIKQRSKVYTQRRSQLISELGTSDG